MQYVHIYYYYFKVHVLYLSKAHTKKINIILTVTHMWYTNI